jgi:hypothetical protein
LFISFVLKSCVSSLGGDVFGCALFGDALATRNHDAGDSCDVVGFVFSVTARTLAD